MLAGSSFNDGKRLRSAQIRQRDRRSLAAERGMKIEVFQIESSRRRVRGDLLSQSPQILRGERSLAELGEPILQFDIGGFILSDFTHIIPSASRFALTQARSCRR